VIIVPHVVSEFTDSLDPIKLYESRAVGIPTLATPVAGFRDCQWPTVLTAPASEFPQQLGALLEQRNVPMPDPDTPTWHGQAQQFHELLQRARAGNERLKVVFLGHTAKQSGGELALVRLLEGFTDVDAHVILAEDGPLVALLHSAGATTEVLPLGGATLNAHRGSVTLRHLPLRKVFSTLRYSVALTRRLQSLQPDLVHTNTLKAAIYGGVAGRLARIPVVWHVRDRIANDYLPPFATKLVRTLSRLLPSGIIANSNATLATLGRRPRRARVVPSPVVYDAVPAKAFSSNAAAVQPEELRIGLIGRISPWKGHDVFLRAFAAADFPVPATALLVGSAMFGEDAYEAELHQLCADLGIADRVQFTGFVADVPSVLATLHIVVHASTIPEPFGQVVVEGMAAGLPVIAANAGGPAEIVTHGVDGLLTPPGDVTALTAALELLAADPALRARLGAAGRARAANFSPEHVAGMVTTVYRSVLASKA
jgi:glycosyltransferase involved in cell wall biosynthesis